MKSGFLVIAYSEGGVMYFVHKEVALTKSNNKREAEVLCCCPGQVVRSGYIKCSVEIVSTQRCC